VQLRDKHAGAVNFVWNYSNELSVFERERRFIGAPELHKYLSGPTKGA
jgi:hypothetical protein